VLTFGLLQLLGYAVIGPPPAEQWHVHVPRIAFGLCLVIGSAGVLEYWAQRRPHKLVQTALGAVSLSLLLSAVSLARRNSAEVAKHDWLGFRHGVYLTVSQWLRDRVHPGQRFFSTEVGTLGYLTGHHMIDPFGLINETNAYPRERSASTHLELVERYEPDLLLVDSPKHADWIAERTDYRTIKVFEWYMPWSTLMVRDPAVLKDQAEYARLVEASAKTWRRPRK
jgi:hypothetical protein